MSDKIRLTNLRFLFLNYDGLGTIASQDLVLYL